MAKYESRLHGDFDAVLDRLEQGILAGSMSASYEDGSDYESGNFRCAVRVYERYSFLGGNRVSLSMTLMGRGRSCSFQALPRGAVRQSFLR